MEGSIESLKKSHRTWKNQGFHSIPLPFPQKKDGNKTSGVFFFVFFCGGIKLDALYSMGFVLLGNFSPEKLQRMKFGGPVWCHGMTACFFHPTKNI